MVADVLGGQGHGAPSVELGNGQVASVADLSHGPQFTVPDDISGGRLQLALVAASGDDVADTCFTRAAP